jgi:hypothetical protein
MAGGDPVASYQVIDIRTWHLWAVVAGSFGLSIYVAIGTLLTQAGVMRFAGPAVLIVMAAGMYQIAFVWVRRIDLTRDAVTLHALARNRRIPLQDLARIRNDPRKPGLALFDGRPGVRLRVAADERMTDFLAAVRKQAPQTDVSVRLYATRGRGWPAR